MNKLHILTLLRNINFPLKEFFFDFFHNHYSKFYFVGGFVRDILLNKSINDIDIVAEDIDYRDFSKKLNKFLKGTAVDFKDNIRIVKNGITIDISKLRGETIREDLKKRDFTINNLAVHLQEGIIGDPSDIEKKFIRMGYEDSFIDDPLRILRGFRFMSELGFEIDNNTLEKIILEKKLLEGVPSERINKELNHLLLGNNCYKTLKLMKDLSVLYIIFPELKKLDQLSGGKNHVEDSIEHSLSVTRIAHKLSENYQTDQDRLSIVIASLLHDVGKGDEKYKETSGKFVGHEIISEQLTKTILKRLSYPNKMIKDISNIVRKHGIIRQYATNGVKDLTLYKFVYENYSILNKLIDISIADAKSKGRDNPKFYETIDKIIQYSKQLDFSKQDLLNGNDLISMGCKKDPKLGEILNEIHFKLASGVIKSRDEAIKYARMKIDQLVTKNR